MSHYVVTRKVKWQDILNDERRFLYAVHPLYQFGREAVFTSELCVRHIRCGPGRGPMGESLLRFIQIGGPIVRLTLAPRWRVSHRYLSARQTLVSVVVVWTQRIRSGPGNWLKSRDGVHRAHDTYVAGRSHPVYGSGRISCTRDGGGYLSPKSRDRVVGITAPKLLERGSTRAICQWCTDYRRYGND